MKINPQITNSDIIDYSYVTLYKIGAIAAIAAALLFRRNLDAEWVLFHSIGLIDFEPSSAPDTVYGWFALLRQNQMIGLLLLNVFDLVNYALVGLIFLSLFIALKKVSPSWMTIVLALAFTGITVYFASNQSFTMLLLSKQYAAAATQVQRDSLLAVAESVLAIHRNAGFYNSGINSSYFMITLAGLIICFIMLRSQIFSKSTAVMGILANGFGLSYYMALLISPTLVFIPLSISAIFLLIWYVQIGFRLWAFGFYKTTIDMPTASAGDCEAF